MRKVIVLVIGVVLVAGGAIVVANRIDCRHADRQHSCPEDQVDWGAMVTVIVVTEDVPPGTELSSRDERLEAIRIPREALLEGWVTKPEQLEGMTTQTKIQANEPIYVSQLAPG